MNVTGHLVECDTCHQRTVVTDGTNVHDALSCRCCGSDHTHAGPDGSTVGPTCRTLTISANAVVVPAIGSAS
jgi:hypothetical protein